MKPIFVYAVWTIAIASLVSAVIFTILNLANLTVAHAASTFTSTTSGGNWAVGSTWAGGTVPGNWSNNTANLNGNITLTSATTDIKGFTAINLNNNKSFTSGSTATANNLTMQNVQFNVVSGTMTVYGNLSLSSSTLSIISGTLNVTGTLSINSGATVTVASGSSITAGSLSISNNSDAILNNNGSVTINGNVSQGGVVNNNSTGAMQINGSLTSTGSGSSIFTNDGSLNVANNVTLPNSGKLYNNPGGKILVSNDVTVSGNLNLVNGTNVAPPQYADLIIQKNLISSNSGDVQFNRNSRVAIFGNVSDSGDGGTLFTVNNGGQVFVNGNINYSGGGNAITNNNTTNPYGFYVNGTILNSGGGSSTTTNQASQATMQTSNPTFYSWVTLQNGTLPIKLVSFRLNEISKQSISLVWSTALEENFDKFQLERSPDGILFNAIAEIQGAGNSKKLLTYSYEDTKPLIGDNYFRLKSIDQDGKFEYSKILFAKIQTANELSIYPNPSRGDFINFTLNEDPDADAVISIFDLSGMQILNQNVMEANGKIIFDYPLKTGTYIFKYTSTTFKSSQRIVVD